MSRWFRFHAEAMRNPKVAKLSDREFRLWVRLLAVACENDGEIPAAEDLKHVLNARLDHLLAGVEALISAGLIDRKDDGYAPHGWQKHQYKSDTSTDRVQKHRGKRNVSETPPDTETDTEKKKVVSQPSKRAFDDWWSVYPNKVAKGAAEKAFAAALKLASLEDLVAGVRRYIETKPADINWKHPATWLNGKCWLDEPAPPTARGSPRGTRQTSTDHFMNLSREYRGQAADFGSQRGDCDDAYGVPVLTIEHQR